MFAYGAVNWMFNFNSGHESGEPHRRHQRSTRSRRSVCEEVLPKEFFQNLETKGGGQCKHPVPTEHDCTVAKHLFAPDSQTRICHKVLSSTSFKLTECNLNSKPADCWSNMEITPSINGESRCHIFYENSKNNSISQRSFMAGRALPILYSLQHHLKANSDKLHYFGLVVCYNTRPMPGKRKDFGEFYYRLIVFNSETPENYENKEEEKQKQFVNLLAIPSLSRSGFYRSFQRSQAAFKSLSATNEATVLDFPMYQSKDLGHLHKYFRILIGQQDVTQASKDADISNTCEPFKATDHSENGPDTMETGVIIEHFMDTKCSKNQVLEYFECYSKLLSGRSHNNGYTLSLSNNFRDFVCKLSSVKSLIDPFFALESVNKSCSERWLLSSVVIKLQLLFADYFLKVRRVTERKQDQKQEVSLLTNVLRTPFEKDLKHSFEAIDQSLADHIQSTGQLSNTITFILSERGFVHPTYSMMSSYGRIEQENPIFFMILPNGLIQNKVFSQFVLLLREHESQLLSIESIHRIFSLTIRMFTFMEHEGSFGAPMGILNGQKYELLDSLEGESMFQYASFPEAETCSNLDIKQPNLCLCEGEYIDFSNDTVQVGTAEFAIGEMNKLLRHAISSEYGLNSAVSREIFTHSPYAYCSKLQGIAFKNVAITHFDNCLRTKLDIYVKSCGHGENNNGDHQSHEKYHVIVDRIYQNNASVLKLTDYTRVHSKSSFVGQSSDCTSLGRYEDSLCICDSSKYKYTFSKSDMLQQLSHKQFGMTPLLINIHGTCLFLVIRHYRHSAAFEAANVCEGRIYEFTLHFHTKGMILSGDRVVKVTLTPMQETFIGVAMQASYHKQEAHVWYTTTVAYRDLK